MSKSEASRFIGPKSWTIEEIEQEAEFLGKKVELNGRGNALEGALVIFTAYDLLTAFTQELITSGSYETYLGLFERDNDITLIVPKSRQVQK